MIRCQIDKVCNIASISSFVFRLLIQIIPKQVIVLFGKTCFHNREASYYSNLINTGYQKIHKINNLINDDNHLVEITYVTYVAPVVFR